jgi:hypothetical protein
MTQFQNKLRIDQGSERLVFLGVFMLFFVHIACCFFVIIPTLIADSEENAELHTSTWLEKYCKDENGEVDSDGKIYLKSLYWVITTVATVGYGDIIVQNSFEMIYCILLMLFGVLLFTFVSGALASILANYDA